MKVRVQPNYDKLNDKDIFGVSIMINDSRYFCKYPIGHQNYETKELAEKAASSIRDILANGGSIEYSSKGSAGKNKSELVLVHENNN